VGLKRRRRAPEELRRLEVAGEEIAGGLLRGNKFILYGTSAHH
jgi:hypothetical protein